MQHEVVRTSGEWSRLESEWNAVLGESRADSLFMTWEWLDTWLDVHERKPELLVICVRDSDGALVGLAPYYKTDYKLFSVVPYRVLRVVGDINSGAEYQSWIAKKTAEAPVCAEIAKALQEFSSEWDLIWMPQMRTWSAAHAPMIDALRASRSAVNQRPNVFTAIPVPDRYEDYLARMSANRRQQVRRMTKRILSKPTVEIRKVGSKEELGPALEALFHLHGKRWRSVGREGVFVRKPKEKEFYRRFTPTALDRGWLAMYTLFDDGEPKAVQIGYVYDGVFLQLQEGFDTDYSPHVGNALRAHVIEDCIRTGLREYDFLGGTSEHKRRWLAGERFGTDLLAYTRRLKNLPIRVGVWPTGAYLRPQA
jgi:CelD/BcsL family acetyltransferase involved in cellulose biosynthesis